MPRPRKTQKVSKPKRSKKCSVSAPGVGEVITISPTPALSQNSDSAAKIWKCIIWKNQNSQIVSSSTIKEWVRINCERAIWQLEKCPETGREHYDLTVHLNKKVRKNWMIRHLEGSGRIEKVKFIEKAFDYSCKEDTRVDGPWYYPEQLTRIPDPLADVTLHPWQVTIKEMLAKPADARKIFWFWEAKGNAGKSMFAEHLFVTMDGVKLVDGGMADTACALDSGDRIIIWDFPREKEQHLVPYQTMEKVKNGLFFSRKYQSKTKYIGRPHILVFANWPPRTEALSEDRWEIVAI